MPGPPKERKNIGHGPSALIWVNKESTDEDLFDYEMAKNVYKEDGLIKSCVPPTATDVGPRPQAIEIGGFDINCWHTSAYPDKFARLHKLILCEFCLGSFRAKNELERHAARCKLRHPPGSEIYRNGDISIFEVRGHENKQYCQNLCMLGKLFLDHKVVYRDVHHFLFYVLTKYDEYGFNLVGYFSKENLHDENVSCIVVLPPYLSKGFGRLLIDFSYLLSKVEGKVGTPEKPLSDMGSISYQKYWRNVFMNYLLSVTPSTTGNVASCRYTICEMERLTAICVSDVIQTLSGFATVEDNQIVITIDWEEVIACIEKKNSYPSEFHLDEKKLEWTPIGRRAVGIGNHRRCTLCPTMLPPPPPPCPPPPPPCPPPPPPPPRRKRYRY